MQTTFQGDNVELRRLGLADIFEVQRIVIDIVNGAEIRGFRLNEAGEGEDALSLITMFLFAGMDFAEERITGFLKSLFIEPYQKDIHLEGILELLELLLDHPDIDSFLARARKLTPKLLAAVKRVSQTPTPPSAETEQPA